MTENLDLSEDVVIEKPIDIALRKMNITYREDKVKAVRGQRFIKIFHQLIADELNNYISDSGKKQEIKVIQEAHIFGSYKGKDVDVAVIHPINGPLISIGVRSQMSSISKNALTYYQDIVGEAVSLQERFPMCVFGYAYVHPLEATTRDNKKDIDKVEHPNHNRYARLYATIGHRSDLVYKHTVGEYDQFSYSVVDFESDPIKLRDDIVKQAVPDQDLSIGTFVARLVDTFRRRNIWLEDLFIAPDPSLLGEDQEE